MANYFATTRSNYFRVKHAAAFETWCQKRCLEIWTRRDEFGDWYAVTADTGDCCGWPFYDAQDDSEFHFADELANYLDSATVAILFEVGAEKHRYLIGQAAAIHPDGRTVIIDLNDIYDRAKETFGPDLTITEARF